MRVALVCPYALDRFGGVQGQVAGLAAALSRREGVEAAIFAPGSSGSEGGVPVRGIGAVHEVSANGSRAPIALAPSVLSRVRFALRAYRPDVVHVHEPFAPMLSLGASLSGAAPVVGTFHRAGAGRGYSRLGTLLSPVAGKITTATAVSEAARSTLALVAPRLAARCQIVGNGVDLTRFGGAPRATSSSPPHLLFVGRHEPRKGLEVLLESAVGLPGEFVLDVVGDGPERLRLQARVEGDVRINFLGSVSDAAVAEAMRAATIFVAPSLSGESFGVVLLEAMAAGVPVIASDLEGYRLAAGDAARYVEPGDPIALGAAITELLGRADQREELAALGATRAEAASFDHLAVRYLALYSSAIAAPRRERRSRLLQAPTLDR